MQNDKQKLGQFFTTNQEYILQGLNIPDDIKCIIEPFAGNGDLITFIKAQEYKNKCKYTVSCYDIQPAKDCIIQRDTLGDPPDYNDFYIITNPPYLARNKSKDKKIFDLYNVNDLYKCFIKELLTNVCLGGIIITPLSHTNFKLK